MKGKHFAKAYWSRTRIVSAILSIALLFGCITFTSAWLIAENEEGPVVNQFTGSMLQISLTPDGTQDPYKLVPGVTYELSEEEDPEITVAAGSVECYLFVVFHEVGTKVNGNPMDFDHYVTYEVGNDFGLLTFDNLDGTWRKGTDPDTELPFKDYVFYYGGKNTQNYVLSPEVPQAQTFDVLQKTNNGKQYFKINETVTKLEAHPNAISVNPYVTFTGYSIQTLGLKPNDGNIDDVKYAWSLVAEAIKDGNTKEVVLN